MRELTARYTDEAQAYRELWAPALLPMIRAHLRRLQVSGVRRALDIGTGVGSALPHLQERFPSASVVGVDRSSGMLRAAPRSPLVQMDASALGLAPACFDFVLMAFVLFHLPDPRVGLLEARRVLRPGGTLALTTWANDVESTATRIWNEELDARGATPLEEIEHIAHHELMDSPEKVRALLEDAGFVGLEVAQRHFAHPMSSDAFIRLRTELGRNRRRFESLPEDLRVECVASARTRISALSADDLTLHMPVVLAAARVAR